MEDLLNESNPGQIRAKKGALVENIAKEITLEVWQRLGNHHSKILFDSTKIGVTKNKIPAIIDGIPDIVSEYLTEDAAYLADVDVHVDIDDQLVLGIECKSYTENAMLKRILIDFWLLKNIT